MAKKRKAGDTFTGDSTPPSRVSPLNPSQVQPGSFGAILSSGTQGIVTSEADQARIDEEGVQRAEAVRTFLSLARSRFKRSEEAESRLREDMQDDLEFYNSDQWPDYVKMERALDKRPILTINRLPQFVRQIVNQARQAKPAIQVNPVDNGADVQTAEVYQGICRQIERQSKAHIAYGTAQEHQAIMGRGWIRVLSEYASDDNFDQEIRIRRVMDALTVYPDPACSEPDYSDATFNFIIERVPKDEYVVRYGDTAARSQAEFQPLGSDMSRWYSDDSIQVAEYFYVESEQITLVECLVNGTTKITMNKDVLKPEDLAMDATLGVPRVTILNQRQSVRKQVKWALINGVEILEGNADRTAGRDVPGPWIPVVPVLGEELVVRGQKNLRGMVRDAKDPQRSYNFWVSAETEMIALAPRAPVIGAQGQFEGHETKWNTANRRNWSYLEYNPVDLNGQLVPPPQRNAYDPNIGPIVQATMQADRDLKSVIGMFDASQERSPEQSGKAIIARQKQGEEGTSHFMDNLSRSIEQVGRILVAWIPVYYDRPRMLRILGLDEQEKTVLIHSGQEQAAQQMMQTDPLAQDIMEGRPFDLGVGRYDVTISVGPSYQSRRQETVDAILQLIQANPAIAPVVSDLLVSNMDWPGAKILAKRLERLVPPEAKDPGDQPQLPPEAQQHMQEQQQQIEALTAALGEKDQIIESKAHELAANAQMKQMEIEARSRETAMRAEIDLMKLEVEMKAEAAAKLLDAKLAQFTLMAEHAHDLRKTALEASLTPEPPPARVAANA